MRQEVLICGKRKSGHKSSAQSCAERLEPSQVTGKVHSHLQYVGPSLSSQLKGLSWLKAVPIFLSYMQFQESLPAISQEMMDGGGAMHSFTCVSHDILVPFTSKSCFPREYPGLWATRGLPSQ